MDELEKMRVKRDLRLPRDLARPSPKSPKDGSPVHKTPAETTAQQAAHQAAQQAAHRYASKFVRKAARKAVHKDAHKHALKTAPKAARKTALARKGERLQEALEKPSEVPSAQPVKLDMATQSQGSGAWSTARRASSTLASDASDDDNAPLSTPRDTCTQLAVGANRRPGGNRSPRYLERRKERGFIGIGQRAPGWSEAAALAVHERVVHLSKNREDKCITKQIGLIISSEIEVRSPPPLKPPP